jgi:hypothetical protein
MLGKETIQQLQHASVAERIQIIELLLQSLKDDMSSISPSVKIGEPFTIRTFNLGEDIRIDRDELYAERGC